MASGFWFSSGLRLGLVLDANPIAANFCLWDEKAGVGEAVGTARCELSVDFLETSSVGATVPGAATAVSSRVCRGNT